MAHRLASATSPYVLQHAQNPVDWWEWGDEAFAEARRRDLPLLISVGYSACHWCHVMAHESFEDPTVAALVNERFVAIKVDREERPDVDAIYLRATQALTGQGGWPMTVFATPDGAPFFAGTYYPPQPTGGQPSFSQVVTALGDAWRDRREEVVASAGAIVEKLTEINEIPQAAEAPGIWELLDAVSADFDLMHGGFGTAPKFPAPLMVDALLVKGEPGSLDLAQRALEAMARGGIHDQIGGGFHRYAVDAGWVVPHFEKMLYDNALLLGAYTRGWRRTPQSEGPLRALFERVVRGIVGWLTREMRLENGAFAASLDADSADIRGMAHEGIYYVWNPELLTDALGAEDADWAAETFHVTTSGTFEHALSTLQLRGAPDPDRLARVSRRLLQVRDDRFPPPRDDKVIASWNGWTIDALVHAALVFGEPAWLAAAEGAAQALWEAHVTDAGLVRASLQGEPSTGPAFAEDHGALALGFARLAQARGDARWLARAEQLLDDAIGRFAAPDGGFFDAAETAELFTRPRDVADNPTPSGTMALVASLRVVGLLADREDFLQCAEVAARTTWGTLAQNPRFAPAALADLLAADDARKGLRPAVAVVVDADGDGLNDAARAAWRMAPAGTVIVSGRPGTPGFAHHFDDRPVVMPAADEDGGGGRPAADRERPGTSDDEYDEHAVVPTAQTVYVCRGTTCFAPASTVQEIREALWTRA
ncbi:MAG: thioredoxin domain-containing protein [Propioniciclava sp.]